MKTRESKVASLLRAQVFRSPLVETFIGAISVRGVGAVLALTVNVMLARMLGTVGYGRYMTLLSAGLLLSGLAVRGSDQLLTREIAAGLGSDRNLKLNRKLWRWAARRVGTGVAVAMLAFFAWALISANGRGSDHFVAIGLGVMVIPLLASCTVLAGATNGYNKPLQSQAIVLVVQNSVVLLMLGVVWFWIGPVHSASFALAFQVCGYLLAVVFGFLWARPRATLDSHQGNYKIDSSKLRTSRSSWSLVARHFLFIAIAGLLINRLDVVLVAMLSGDHVAGVYAAGARFAQVAMLVGLGINMVLNPRIAAAWAAHDKEKVRRLVISALTFTIPIAIVEISVVMPAAPDVATLFGNGYAGTAWVIRWVVVAYALWTVAAPGYALLAMTGKEKAVSGISWLVLGANATCMFLFVPRYGASGAALAIMVGYASSLVPLLIFVWRQLTRSGLRPVSPCRD